MSSPANAPPFTLTLEGVAYDFHILAFDGSGAIGQPSLVSGHCLHLEQHPGGDWNQLWLLTEIQHQGHGALAIPRIGMEVLVGFLEGDPDQPLVLGHLQHTEHRPPLELPKGKTLSSFKSLGSPDGSGYNELRFEDRQGQEEIHVHAQRDRDERIGHDHRSEIGHERHQRIRRRGAPHHP